jgi:hypothetical protein
MQQGPGPFVRWRLARQAALRFGRLHIAREYIIVD